MMKPSPKKYEPHEAVPLRFTGDDRALVGALKVKHPGAMEALYDRYAAHVERVLARVMGFDTELYDLVQEVFIEAFKSVAAMKDGQALNAWLTTLSVFTARQCIRKRRRRRVYWVKDPDNYMEVPVNDADPSEIEALRLTYQALETMATDDRIVFSLRFIQGMNVAEVATTCRVSVSTAKRRLKRAETRFSVIARRFPALLECIEQGERRRNT
jgi:RNA polymerase sigma-70 factor (ECF subfamily)